MPESIAHMASGLTGLFSQVRKEGVKIMLYCCHTALIPWLAWGQAVPEQKSNAPTLVDKFLSACSHP